ncbi:hypothetical protein [Streptomyces sp. CA-253872]|uniref:hypothetical protein n=1 Tax=Streptomyces sp. CA-253872 TaxID=3240067 RepID=UPI003D8F14CC
MPGRSAIAATSGIITGVTLTLATVDEVNPTGALSVILNALACLAPLTCVIIVSQAALRHWMRSQSEQARADLRAQVVHHKALTSAEFNRRSVELDLREQRVTEQAETAQRQLIASAQELKDLRAALEETRSALAESREDYKEVLAERNWLVEQSLRDGAARFTARPTGQSVHRFPRPRPRTASGLPLYRLPAALGLPSPRRERAAYGAVALRAVAADHEEATGDLA